MDKPIKPISLRRKEFTDDLAKLINKSELPPIFLIDILGSALGVLRAQQEQNEAEEEEEYRKKLVAYVGKKHKNSVESENAEENNDA